MVEKKIIYTSGRTFFFHQELIPGVPGVPGVGLRALGAKIEAPRSPGVKNRTGGTGTGFLLETDPAEPEPANKKPNRTEPNRTIPCISGYSIVLIILSFPTVPFKYSVYSTTKLLW